MLVAPHGWSIFKLDELASSVTYGYTAKSESSSGDARMLRITDIQQGRVSWTRVPFCSISEKDKENYALKSYDLVFARTGATVGKSYLVRDVPEDVVFASYLIRVRLKDQGMSRYMAHFFNSYAYWEQITDFSAGIGQPNVNGTKLKSLLVPVAPENEQKRIADKLDTVLTRVDAVNTRLARVAPLLKRFRQAILAAATSGRLTEDWRARANGFSNWTESTLGDLIVEMRNGLATKPDEHSSGSKILRISAVRPGELDISDHRYLTTSPNESALYRLLAGDLMFTRYNGSLEFVGVCALVQEDLPGYVYPDKLIRVRVNPAAVLPKYLELASSATSARLQIEGFVKSSAGQKGISGADLKSLRVSLPNIEEQTEIVRRVETLFAFADRLQARLAQAQTAATRLTPALLAKAFRGELVPQDPNDEPAAELLRRLTGNAATTPAAKASRARRKSA